MKSRVAEGSGGWRGDRSEVLDSKTFRTSFRATRRDRVARKPSGRKKSEKKKTNFLHHRFFFCGINITGILNPNTKLEQANTISFNKDESRHPNSLFWSFNLLGFLLEPSFGRSGSSSIFSTRNRLNSAECVLSLQNSYSSGSEH